MAGVVAKPNPLRRPELRCVGAIYLTLAKGRPQPAWIDAPQRDADGDEDAEATGAEAAQHQKAQGQGLGEVLMTSALAAFRREGLNTASLSVTFDNRRAYGLYQRLGFRLRKEFAAHAWVRPPARIELHDGAIGDALHHASEAVIAPRTHVDLNATSSTPGTIGFALLVSSV